jgi:hypothetical protein
VAERLSPQTLERAVVLLRTMNRSVIAIRQDRHSAMSMPIAALQDVYDQAESEFSAMTKRHFGSAPMEEGRVANRRPKCSGDTPSRHHESGLNCARMSRSSRTPRARAVALVGASGLRR